MMLMDFCHHSVKTLIKSDKVSFDGYEVSNLVSEDPCKRHRGFICDHFIKPPVNIYLQFPCNISIFRIIINPVVSQQKSCDIKLLTATKIMLESWLYGRDQTSVQLDGIFFNCIGSVRNDDPETVCFENSFFPRRETFETCDRSFALMSNLNSKKHFNLTNVSHLNICINRTKLGKAVAIQSVEVWGIPSSKVPKPVQEKLQTAYTKAVAKTSQRSKSTAAANKKKEGKNDDVKTSQQSLFTIEQNGVIIPEDFLDPLTFEIMTIPLLLPSGKSIDQLTLDKFVNMEASWGRQPSDPFTGLPFSTKSKPEINSSLKSRVDQFVLSHSDKLETPRTLGHVDSSGTSEKPGFGDSHMKRSRLIKSNHFDENLNSENMKGLKQGKRPIEGLTDNLAKRIKSCTDTCHTLSVVPQSNTSYNASKRMKSNTDSLEHLSNTGHNLVKKTKTSADTLFDQKSVYESSHKSFVNQSNNSHTTDLSPFNPDFHTSHLTSSLDSALEAALGGLPSFSTRKAVPSPAATLSTSRECSESNKSSCANCKLSLLDTNLVKYSLHCGHILCRQCLNSKTVDVRQSEFFCDICKLHCNSREVVRIF